MQTTGTLTHDGKTEHVTGTSDFDRQWGFNPVLAVVNTAGLFFTLPDGRDIFIGIVRLRQNGNEATLYGGSISDAHGNVTTLHRGDFSMTPMGFWRRDATCSYPVGWDVHVAGLHLHVRPSDREAEVRATRWPILFALWPEWPTYWGRRDARQRRRHRTRLDGPQQILRGMTTQEASAGVDRQILNGESITWRYVGDARFWLVVGSAFVLQVMHPTVAAGVADHSDYLLDPWRRLVRTWDALLRTVYLPDGDHSGEEVRQRHRHIRGVDRAGRHYHAYEPEAYWWVLATGVKATLTFAELFARPLSARDAERLYAESREIGRRFGLRDRDMQPTLAEFNQWCATIIDSRLEDNPTVRDLLQLLREPPRPRAIPAIPWPPLRTGGSRLAWLTTIGTLPPRAREMLGIPWSPSQEAALRAVAAASRTIEALPDRWRYVETARRGFAIEAAQTRAATGPRCARHAVAGAGDHDSKSWSLRL